MHSPELWTLSHEADGVTLILAGDKIIARLKNGAIYGGQSDDAARIVACVNACRGIPTEVLVQKTNPLCPYCADTVDVSDPTNLLVANMRAVHPRCYIRHD